MLTVYHGAHAPSVSLFVTPDVLILISGEDFMLLTYGSKLLVGLYALSTPTYHNGSTSTSWTLIVSMRLIAAYASKPTTDNGLTSL